MHWIWLVVGILCLYSTTPLRDQAASTMTRYPTQSHYLETEQTSPCPVLIMPSARLGSNKYNFLSHWFDSTKQMNVWPSRLVLGAWEQWHLCNYIYILTSILLLGALLSGAERRLAGPLCVISGCFSRSTHLVVNGT